MPKKPKNAWRGYSPLRLFIHSATFLFLFCLLCEFAYAGVTTPVCGKPSPQRTHTYDCSEGVHIYSYYTENTSSMKFKVWCDETVFDPVTGEVGIVSSDPVWIDGKNISGSTWRTKTPYVHSTDPGCCPGTACYFEIYASNVLVSDSLCGGGEFSYGAYTAVYPQCVWSNSDTSDNMKVTVFGVEEASNVRFKTWLYEEPGETYFSSGVWFDAHHIGSDNWEGSIDVGALKDENYDNRYRNSAGAPVKVDVYVEDDFCETTVFKYGVQPFGTFIEPVPAYLATMESSPAGRLNALPFVARYEYTHGTKVDFKVLVDGASDNWPPFSGYSDENGNIITSRIIRRKGEPGNWQSDWIQVGPSWACTDTEGCLGTEFTRTWNTLESEAGCWYVTVEVEDTSCYGDNKCYGDPEIYKDVDWDITRDPPLIGTPVEEGSYLCAKPEGDKILTDIMKVCISGDTSGVVGWLHEIPHDRDCGCACDLDETSDLIIDPDEVVDGASIQPELASGEVGEWGHWDSVLPRGYEILNAPQGTNTLRMILGASAENPQFSYVLSCVNNSAAGVIGPGSAAVDLLSTGINWYHLGYKLVSNSWVQGVGGLMFGGNASMPIPNTADIPGGFLGYLLTGNGIVFSNGDVNVINYDGADVSAEDSDGDGYSTVAEGLSDSDMWPATYLFNAPSSAVEISNAASGGLQCDQFLTSGSLTTDSIYTITSECFQSGLDSLDGADYKIGNDGVVIIYVDSGAGIRFEENFRSSDPNRRMLIASRSPIAIGGEFGAAVPLVTTRAHIEAMLLSIDDITLESVGDLNADGISDDTTLIVDGALISKAMVVLGRDRGLENAYPAVVARYDSFYTTDIASKERTYISYDSVLWSLLAQVHIAWKSTD
jgi:hypothetical protein